MDAQLINVYIFLAIFCALIVVVVLVAFGLFFCLEEMKKREIQEREKYLESVKTFVIATSNLADATTKVQDR